MRTGKLSTSSFRTRAIPRSGGGGGLILHSIRRTTFANGARRCRSWMDITGLKRGQWWSSSRGTLRPHRTSRETPTTVRSRKTTLPLVPCLFWRDRLRSLLLTNNGQFVHSPQHVVVLNGAGPNQHQQILAGAIRSHTF